MEDITHVLGDTEENAAKETEEEWTNVEENIRVPRFAKQGKLDDFKGFVQRKRREVAEVVGPKKK